MQEKLKESHKNDGNKNVKVDVSELKFMQKIEKHAERPSTPTVLPM